MKSLLHTRLFRTIVVLAILIGIGGILSFVLFPNVWDVGALFKTENSLMSDHGNYLSGLKTQVFQITGTPYQTAISIRITIESDWATKVSDELQSLTSTPMQIRTLYFSTPFPTTAVTPEIFDCFAFRRIPGFTEANCWHGFNAGQDLIVVMMQENANPQQTWIYMEFAKDTPPFWIKIPSLEMNPVKIKEMDDFVLIMQAENSDRIYYFDTLAREFVSSLKQPNPTATTVPTILPTFPPPTYTPRNPYP